MMDPAIMRETKASFCLFVTFDMRAMIDMIADLTTVAPPPVMDEKRTIPTPPKMLDQRVGRNENMRTIASPIIEIFEPERTTI
jgi:hypothetical protein